MTTGNEEWGDNPQTKEEATSNHPGDRPRGSKPVPIVPDEPEKVAATAGKPKINWTQLLLAVILAAVLAGAFVIQWAPSKADVNILRSDMAEAVDAIASRNGTIDNLVTSVGELRMKVDSWVNADYVTGDELDSELDDYVTSSDFAAFVTMVTTEMDSGGGILPQQSEPLVLTTTYERDEMQFNVSKAADNTTAYFTIEGAVYYDSAPPATPTPTPMLDGFELVYATEGMSMFAMTTFGKTETGGVKGYDFTAPVGTWYYNFWITPLSVGGNVTSGSTW